MGEIFKIFGKGGEPYIGGLSILWGGLENPLQTMLVIGTYLHGQNV